MHRSSRSAAGALFVGFFFVVAGSSPASPLPAGQMLVGAAKVSMEPRPADYNGIWVQNFDACATLSASFFSQLPGSAEHLASAGSPWPENPNCLYMGGFGIGPMNPIVAWDQENGLYVRSIALGDGTDTLVLTIIDSEGYFWDYQRKCPDYDCGGKKIAQAVGQARNIPAANFVIAATHSHASPDLIGGWGFVPDWYMRQVSDTIKASINQALDTMRPAVVEVGEEQARAHNNERRDTYRSAEEQQLTWLRATDAANGGAIATLGAYAAHPTTKGTNGGTAHADWPGVFVKRLEQRFGGVGLLFMTGLGNMSTSGGTQMGVPLANLIPEIGKGTALSSTDLRITQTTWRQPATNVPLTALGLPGFFDRKFDATPAEVQTGKTPDTAPCLSASAFSVEVATTAARIGDKFALTASPGEIFSNVSNTIKEKSGALVTMPFGQANDALGYMPQNFEMSPIGQQGLGFVVGGVLIVNYEDSYSIDHCYGDMALETAIRLLNQIQ